MNRLTSWDDFWPWYLEEHSDPRNQWLHVLAVITNVVITATALISGRWALLLVGPLCAYSMAWTGHLVFQRNVPASIRYPYWSLKAELRMVWLKLRGVPLDAQ